MTTLSLNELSRAERRRLGLPDSLDLLPPAAARTGAAMSSTSTRSDALLTRWRGAWDNLPVFRRNGVSIQ